MENKKILNVSFSLWCPYAKTGQSVYVCGNINSLGNWSLENSVKLYATGKNRDIWKSKNFKCEFHNPQFEYKYIIRGSKGEVIEWEGFKHNRVVNLNDYHLFGSEEIEGKVIIYDQEFSLPKDANVSLVQHVEDADNDLENECIANLRRDFDLSFSSFLELKAHLQQHKLPVEEFRELLCSKYNKITEKVSQVLKSIEFLCEQRDVEESFDKLIAELEDGKKLSDELTLYISHGILVECAKTESKFSEIIDSYDKNIKEKLALSKGFEKRKEEILEKVPQLKSEYAEKDNVYQGIKAACDGPYLNFLGGPDFRQQIHGPKLRIYEGDLRITRAHIDDMELSLKKVGEELRSLMRVKQDMEAVSKVFNGFLDKITSIANKVTEGTIFLDEMITGIASVRVRYENLRLIQEITLEELHFDIEDPKSLRNETLNIKEFEERYQCLKNKQDLTPLDQREYECLSNNWEEYKQGKLQAQTIQIYRLNAETPYYFVKLPEKKIPLETQENLILNLNKCKNFLDICFKQRDQLSACLNEFSPYFESQLKQIDEKIEIRKQKSKLLDEIQAVRGSGESETTAIHDLAIKFMNKEGSKGVLMIAHKDRHDSDVKNCPIIETEFYTVYLGIQEGSVKMRSFKGGFLNLGTFYYRGYENWCFSGVGGYPLPQIEDNGIKVCKEDGQNNAEFQGLYYIQCVKSGKNFDVSGGSYDNEARIIQYAFHGCDNQKFQVTHRGNGYFSIEAKHSGKALGIEGGSNADWGRLIQYTYHGHDNQLFKFIKISDNIYTISCKHSGKVLDVSNCSISDCAEIIQHSGHGGENQQFRLSRVI